MDQPAPQQDPVERLRARLNEVHDWPSVYMYKMVLEPDEDKIAALLAIFPPEAEVLRRYSGSGRFVSITLKQMVMSAEEVLDRYDRVHRLGGVMML
ncbi:MAG: DUF493 family protein [Flavobacteriales bacterium]|jgi:hypothetical protein|nr:DUF493 family protein [Flavobacteriales bacterium]